MARYLIIGVEGEEQLWLVDCQSETVERVDAGTLGGSDVGHGDIAANLSEARGEGFTIVRGIDLAIASESRTGIVVHARFTGDGE